MKIDAVCKTRSFVLAGAALLLAAAAPATAMPVAPAAQIVAASGAPAVEVVTLHRRYPGYHSHRARAYRHMRRMMPSRYCKNQPSRCR